VRIAHRLVEFLFPAASDTWLAILRIGLGLQVLLYCLSLWPDWNGLFVESGNTFINRDVTEAIFTLDCSFLPRLSWFVQIGRAIGLEEEKVLSIILFVFLASGCCLVLGLVSRSAAIVAWLLHLAAVTSGGLMSYGVDNFMTIGLFYLMVSPLPDRYSLDSRLTPRPAKDPQQLGFFRRVLQLHLCFIYFFGGLDKMLGSGWWNGVSIWRALTRPPFNVIPTDILARWSFLLPAAGILICLLEIGYPIGIWPAKSRPFWLVAIVGMHLGIASAMGMYLFGLIMIVLNLAAFGSTLRLGWGPGLISTAPA